ncbi:MAG: hypothetical protein E2O61_10675 [Gammaproteobacteria bacterium]|nr:MAG: hypothetical protein E2O61_10675 [Gammaproteobacteria bacterium]
MPYSYKIEDGIVFTKVTGEVTVEEQNEFSRTWLADPDLPSPLLVCRESVDLDSLTAEVIKDSAKFASTLDIPDGSRLAIVVDADVTYGLSRVYEARTAELDFDIGIFRDCDEAIKWLRQESDS